MAKVVDDYRALLLADTPFIDTRSPGEFAKGSLPGAVNLPLMTDDERAQVGTCYKRQGQAAAIELGHQLVCGATKEQRVAGWQAFAEANPGGALFCWRGGLRSQTCQSWLLDAGVDYPRVSGGYKALRRFLLDEQQLILDETPLVILGGHTGCAKTALLSEIEHSIDLEGLANHRGSAFGKRAVAQPSQLGFENALAIELLRKAHARSETGKPTPLVLEDESRLIGRIALPLNLQQAMTHSPMVLVESSLDERIEHTFENYILSNYRDWQHLSTGEGAFSEFATQLREGMKNIRRRLGGLRFQEVSELLERALVAHESGDDSLHREWIALLLRDYYDPMYEYQLEKRAPDILFKGRPEEVKAYLNG